MKGAYCSQQVKGNSAVFASIETQSYFRPSYIKLKSYLQLELFQNFLQNLRRREDLVERNLGRGAHGRIMVFQITFHLYIINL